MIEPRKYILPENASPEEIKDFETKRRNRERSRLYKINNKEKVKQYSQKDNAKRGNYRKEYYEKTRNILPIRTWPI